MRLALASYALVSTSELAMATLTWQRVLLIVTGVLLCFSCHRVYGSENCDSCSSGAEVKPNSKQPNILFLIADQLRADALGCFGNKVARTPNIDRLAADGVRFRNAFSSTPTCTPARAAILTGLSPWYHGMLGYGVIAPRYSAELPRTLSENGYFTYSIGKDHFGWNATAGSGIAHGYHGTYLYDGLPDEVDNYDYWFMKMNPGDDPMATGLEFNDYRGKAYVFPEYYHPTAWVGRKAVTFLQEYNQSNPFMLKVSFHRPHSPYDPPARCLDYFKPADMPSPFTGDYWDTRYAIKYNVTPPPDIWCGDLGEEQVKASRQAYYGSITFVDEWIGYIMETIEKRSLLENTLILFIADHGDMIGDHYHWRKSYPYFGSASIPMLLRWPSYMDLPNGGDIEVPRGSVLDEVIELRDIFPTFLDASGVQCSHTLNGSSLLQLLKSKGKAWREYIDLEHDLHFNITNHWNALTDGHTKYIFRAYFADEQLFNLDADPEEKHNLANDAEWTIVLEMWRNRMVEQFEREQRGPLWVQNGRLMKRIKGQPYSPNYPGPR